MAIASETNANKLQKKGEKNCNNSFKTYLFHLKPIQANQSFCLQFDNKMVVLKTLAKAVLQSKSLLKVQPGQLVLFLLELHYELFKVCLAFCPDTLITKLFVSYEKAKNSLNKWFTEYL